MTVDYKDVPLFLSSQIQAVPEYLFAEAVRGVVRETGCDDEQAMRVVEAVFGPLRLISPVAQDPEYTTCPYVYFAYEGGWKFCHKQHGVEGEDPEFHNNNADDLNEYAEWDHGIGDDRVIKIDLRQVH